MKEKKNNSNKINNLLLHAIATDPLCEGVIVSLLRSLVSQKLTTIHVKWLVSL